VQDNQAYKSAELRAAEEARDPLPKLREFLVPKQMSADEWAALERSVEAELEAALDRALKQPEGDPATARRYAFFDGHVPVQGGLRASGYTPREGNRVPLSDGARLNLIDAVRRTLDSELAANPRLLVFGEDVGVKGGVHGATLDLQSRYGEARVFDTSLSEEGIIGRAVGLALAGLMPAPEIQFRKYADPATEQINDCGTLRWRTNGQFAAPLVVRIPVGFGRKVGDPWHSVTGEAVFAHAVGWRVAFPSNAADAAGLLRAALRGDDPTMFLEHRALYDTAPARRPYPGDDYVLPFGVAAVVQPGDTLTVVTWGETVHRCVEAAAPFKGRVEILDLRTIVPWDREAVLASVRKTARCLVVHEDTWTGGFGAEIAATVAQEAFTELDAPVERIASADVPVPYSTTLIKGVVPQMEQIRTRIQSLLEY
jgi:2-oxoisovalerate dehydrogenase E1 component